MNKLIINISILLAILNFFACTTNNDTTSEVNERILEIVNTMENDEIIQFGIEFTDVELHQASEIGKVNNEINYIIYRGKEAGNWGFVLGLKSKSGPDPDCSVDVDAGLRAQKKFGECVVRVIGECGGALLHIEDGVMHAHCHKL